MGATKLNRTKGDPREPQESIRHQPARGFFGDRSVHEGPAGRAPCPPVSRRGSIAKVEGSGALAPDVRGPFVGSAIAVVFGLVFIVVNSSELPTAWSLGLRLVAVLVAAVLVIGSVRRLRHAAGREGLQIPMAFGRRYWFIVAAEVAALVVGLILINGVLQVGRFAVAWVAVVVGVHFLGLATIWWPRGFAMLGAVIALLGVAGFVVGALGGSAAAIGVTAGVSSGAALFVMVAASLARS